MKTIGWQGRNTNSQSRIIIGGVQYNPKLNPGKLKMEAEEGIINLGPGFPQGGKQLGLDDLSVPFSGPFSFQKRMNKAPFGWKLHFWYRGGFVVRKLYFQEWTSILNFWSGVPSVYWPQEKAVPTWTTDYVFQHFRVGKVVDFPSRVVCSLVRKTIAKLQTMFFRIFAAANWWGFLSFL